jgi:hypothetical protein
MYIQFLMTVGYSLVYIHIGTELPKYLCDSLYQTLLINGYKTKVYVILSDCLISEFNKSLDRFNLDYYINDETFYFKNLVNLIPLSLLEMYGVNNQQFTEYKNVMTTKFSNLSGFRDGFWISTTSRFFYLAIFMEMFSVYNVFHIESDIMMYWSFEQIYYDICNTIGSNLVDKVCMVEDAPGRVIPSILFFPDYIRLSQLTQFITNELSTSNTFMNDMDILGKFGDRYNLPTNSNGGEFLVYDGAALGQYLGGVDYRNVLSKDVDYTNLTSDQEMVIYDNPTRGFINETAVTKPDAFDFSKIKTEFDNLCVPIRIPVLSDENNSLVKISNLHIHSKQLYQFSSACDLLFGDIISGDRILGLCDFVLTTPEIYNFHKNAEKYAKDIIIIRDFGNINMELLNKYFREHCKVKGVTFVKIFIYTHMLDNFQRYVFPNLDASIEYVFYFHNSDHAVTDDHGDILNSKYVRKIYAQNIDTTVNSDKISLLPIGMANSMWRHGDLLKLYKVISETYREKKEKSIYVNINPKTYAYRKNVLDKIIEYGNFDVSSGKPYEEYLVDLASHRFCLCLRGNGIDTHRFWESLYMGVIPVIVSNKVTSCKNFIKYLKKMDVPFYEICEDDLDKICKKYTSDYFSEGLYKKLISKCKSTIYNLDCLRMHFYEYENTL